MRISTGIARPALRQSVSTEMPSFRQAEIEDDRVIGLGVARNQPSSPSIGAVDRIARARQRIGDLAVQIPVVLDNEKPQIRSP